MISAPLTPLSSASFKALEIAAWIFSWLASLSEGTGTAKIIPFLSLRISFPRIIPAHSSGESALKTDLIPELLVKKSGNH